MMKTVIILIEERQLIHEFLGENQAAAIESSMLPGNCGLWEANSADECTGNKTEHSEAM